MNCSLCNAALNPRAKTAVCQKCRRSHPVAIREMQEKRLATLRAQTADQRLARFRVIHGDDECWGWTGAQNGIGYGVLTFHSQQRMATHLALEVDGRPRPSDEHVACHACDNPPCTNPRHLWWGTEKDNMQDAAQKGRLSGWSRVGKTATKAAWLQARGVAQ